MDEVEQEAVQGDASKENELVSIYSIQLNKKHSVLTANLKMSAGQNNLMVPYKIDTGSHGNIMLLHMYNKLLPSITNEQLATTKSKNVLIKQQNHNNLVRDVYSNYRT